MAVEELAHTVLELRSMASMRACQGGGIYHHGGAREPHLRGATDGGERRRWRSSPSRGCSPRGGRTPITSCSTIVTSAPRRAAWVAAVLPAGPPPMITKRIVTRRGYRGCLVTLTATGTARGSPLEERQDLGSEVRSHGGEVSDAALGPARRPWARRQRSGTPGRVPGGDFGRTRGGARGSRPRQARGQRRLCSRQAAAAAGSRRSVPSAPSSAPTSCSGTTRPAPVSRSRSAKPSPSVDTMGSPAHR